MSPHFISSLAEFAGFMFGSFLFLIIRGVMMVAKIILFKTAGTGSWKKMPASFSFFRVNERTSNRSHSNRSDQKCRTCLPEFFVLYGLLLHFINCNN
ncbi:hypothetical protein A4R26_33280 [Niastella populi]|uniref:Uncharacterized protein n=1 Tax=Niastella populi TaxID=550983 RepID=A0A1V9GAP6_9BACT|nr:hypothetical protein A4R26_33280 [Niastella populi]